MGVRFGLLSASAALVLAGCGSDASDAESTAGSGGSASVNSEGASNESTSATSNESTSATSTDSTGSTSGATSSGTTGGNSGGLAFGDEQSGDGTYYDADGSGACLFDPSPGDLDVAAINAPTWANSSWCGACAHVEGPMGNVTVRIVDLCPECKSGDLDLSPQAFEQIAPLEQGRVPISWTFVSCEVTGPVKYRYKDGTNQWWTAVQVLNHALPIESLEWSADGTDFKAAVRQDYNYFLDDSGFGANPVTVRITAIDGQTLTDELPAPEELLIVGGKKQFE